MRKKQEKMYPRNCLSETCFSAIRRVHCVCVYCCSSFCMSVREGLRIYNIMKLKLNVCSAAQLDAYKELHIVPIFVSRYTAIHMHYLSFYT